MTVNFIYGGFIEVINDENYEFYYDSSNDKFTNIDQFVTWAVTQVKLILENEHIELDESKLNYFTNGLYTYNEDRRSYVGEYRLTEILKIHCEMFEKINK